MKIVALIDNDPFDGGGFNQAVNSVLRLKNLCSGTYEIEIIVTKKTTHKLLLAHNIDATIYKFGFVDYLYNLFSRTVLFNLIVGRTGLLSNIEKYLYKRNCNLIYFVTPSTIACSIQKLNYIFTLWDLAYRENLEFPEVRELGKFMNRESVYRHVLPRAFLIVTVSDDLAKMVSQIFSVPKERILTFPLERSPFLDKETSQEIINKRVKNLKGNQYLFYPAQYWPHKNHIRILQALNYINKSYGWCPKLVLVGKDKGNLSMLKDYVKDQGLDANVLFFDFLDYTDFNYLYRHAYAIVMPTYFGPSNIVPLEAWHLKIPLIYSEDLEISKNSGALLINPDNHQDLAKAILEVFKNEVREKQVIEGQRSLEIHNDLFKLKEKELIHLLKIYEVRMETWQNL